MSLENKLKTPNAEVKAHKDSVVVHLLHTNTDHHVYGWIPSTK